MHVYFAPMEGITTYIYRQQHHHYYKGVEIYFTPFVSLRPDQVLSTKEMRDVLPENNEGMPVVPQILTNHAGGFLETAKRLAQMGYGEINLNLGCPSGTVAAKKKGAGFLAFPEELDRFLDTVYTDPSVVSGEFAISIKTRIGRNDPQEWERLLQIYNQYPLKELIVHPRVQKEFYRGAVHRDIFREIMKESKNPVVYNGDLFDLQAVERFHADFPQMDTIMIGRGLLQDPALAEIIEAVFPGESFEEKKSAEKGQISEEVRIDAPEGRNTQNTQTGNISDMCPDGRFQEFHNALLNQYREVIGDDRNVLFKMKDLWNFMLQGRPDGAALAKEIRKAQRMPEYKAAVRQVIRRMQE